MRANRFLATVAMIQVIAPMAASAHHSVGALFDRDQTIEISGELTRLFWRNPHVRLWVTDSDGRSWELETSVIGFFERTGITSDLFAEGTEVQVLAHPARSSENLAYATNVLLADGREVLMERTAEPRWSDSILDTTERLEIDAAVVADAERRADGIFRVWTNTRGQEWTAKLSEAALDARAAWNPETDDPRLKCIAPGMVDAMTSPYPMELSRDGDDVIVIRMEEWDGVRRIHLTEEPDATVAPSPMGYSIGHWEGNTFTVTTDRITWPYFDSRGTPQSENVKIVERFTLSDDERDLDWEAVITDPEYLEEPAIVTQGYTWVPGEQIMTFDCTIPE